MTNNICLIMFCKFDNSLVQFVKNKFECRIYHYLPSYLEYSHRPDLKGG